MIVGECVRPVRDTRWYPLVKFQSLPPELVTSTTVNLRGVWKLLWGGNILGVPLVINY